MIADWILDHPLLFAGALVLAAAGTIVGLLLSGSLSDSCPAGQTEQFAYFQPIIINGSTTLIPIYTCQATP